MFILSEHSDAIGTLTLNQPAKRNALSEALVEELTAALTDFQQTGIRVVIIRAASGASVWSSGHDISELPQGKDPLPYSDPFERALRAVKTFPAPVIAMVHGSVWGVATDLVLSCDLVIGDKTCSFAVTLGSRELFEECSYRRNSGESNPHHHAAVARRLLHWTCGGTSARALDGALEIICRYHRHDGAWPANAPQCLLGAARALVVWSNRSRHAFCSDNGNALVGGHRYRDWCTQCSPDLSSRGINHGLEAISHLVQGNLALGASVHR